MHFLRGGSAGKGYTSLSVVGGNQKHGSDVSVWRVFALSMDDTVEKPQQELMIQSGILVGGNLLGKSGP